MPQPLPIEAQFPIRDSSKLQLYSLDTPNGIKVAIALEELGLPYEAHRVDIMKGDQFTDAYKSVSPNSKIPALVDPNGPGGKPLAIMESGAILIYLAEKAGRLYPTDPVLRSQCLQWLFFQVGHVGPMFGQFGHFFKYAKDKCDHPYPVARYTTETRRLLAVLEQQLSDKDYLIGDFTIADIATFPWVRSLDFHYDGGEALKLSEFTHVNAWLERCMARPSFQVGKLVTSQP